MASKLVRAFREYKRECDDEKISLKQKIKEFFEDRYDDIRWRCYDRPKRRIETCFAYAKQAWTHCDNDYAELYDDIIFKITRLRNHIDSHNLFVGCEKRVAEMDEVLKLLKRVRNDEYSEEYREKMEKKYGKLRMYTEMFPDEESHGVACVTLYDEERKNPMVSDELHKVQRQNWKDEKKERDNDRRKAFRLIAKYIEGWWD